MIVLAAGRSRRFGYANKLLAPLRGEPLLWRVLDAAFASRARPVIVVLGHQAAALRRSLRQYRHCRRPVLRPRCVSNRAYRDGIASSLNAGLAALPAAADGALICLGDMPGIGGVMLDRLCGAYRHGDEAVLPIVAGRRGNPVLIGRPLFAAIRSELRGDEGARRLIARAVQVREVPGPRAALHDVDTRRDWRRLQARH